MIKNPATKKIFILTTKGIIRPYKILLTSLGAYKKTRIRGPGRGPVYARPKTLSKLYDHTKKRGKIGYKRVAGTTKDTNRKYVRHEFSLWRHPLRDDPDLDKLMLKIRKKYDTVKNKERRMPGQRIGIIMGTHRRRKITYRRKLTGRLHKIEAVDAISTASYDRDKTSTNMMFKELYEKIYKTFYEGEGYTLSLDEHALMQALKFMVFHFEQ